MEEELVVWIQLFSSQKIKKINEANACIINEWDKICGYPILEEYVKNNICNPCYL